MHKNIINKISNVNLPLVMIEIRIHERLSPHRKSEFSSCFQFVQGLGDRILIIGLDT